MQWVKYLFLYVALSMAGWAAWTLYRGQYGQWVMAVLALAIIGAVYYFFLSPIIRQDALATRLATDGIAVTAQIVQVKSTSKYVNELPLMSVQVRYRHDGQEIVSEVEQAIPFQALAGIQPGASATILIDPKNERNFLLSF